MDKKKVIYNYNIEQSNQLIKKGMFPIGCGINPKSGGFFLVFSGTQGYYNTLDLIALESKQKEQTKSRFYMVDSIGTGEKLLEGLKKLG